MRFDDRLGLDVDGVRGGARALEVEVDGWSAEVEAEPNSDS